MKKTLRPMLFWAVLALLGSSVFLSGCGQKGDLYQPEASKEESKKPSRGRPY